MSSSEQLQPAAGLRRTAKVLTLLVIVAIVLMAASFGYLAYYGDFDRQYVERSESVRVLSQTIADNAAEAASGDTEALAALAASSDRLRRSVETLANGNRDTGLPPTAQLSKPASRALDQVAALSQQLRADVDAILQRRETVQAVAQIDDSFVANVPRLQALSEQLASRLTRIDASRAQVYYATRAQLFAERMGRHGSALRSAGSGGVDAAERLGVASARFGEIVQAMLNGGGDLGVSALRDGQARDQLQEMAKVFATMTAELAPVVEQSPQLVEVRDAANSILTVSERLFANAETLSGIYRGLAAERLVNQWVGFAFGAAALVVLLLRAIVGRRIAKRDLAATQQEREKVNEVARRNQDAILNLLDEIEGLKEGDLTLQASVGEEITGAIADAFNDAIDALRSLATTINETSVQVSSAAQQTQATAMHLAEASDHQAHQITAASGAVNDMAVSIDQVSRNAEESARVAQQSVELALRGAQTVTATIEQMDAIREQIQETSKRIKRLGESSQEIGNIVELINDIADQTNILALNASIQAAMAGESGRGFAVVADEVQRLAERSGNATKQIEALVKTIQTDTNEAVISMEQSTTGVVAGAQQAENAGDALNEIESVSQQLAGLISNISDASRQQADAAANVSDTMNVIQEITSQTSAGTNETATSIGNLADLANELRGSVAGFKLPETK